MSERGQHTSDSRYAAARLVVAVVLMTIGAAGMYVVPVALPAVQAEFGVARAEASMPYSLLMLGFGLGGLLMGRFADRYGVMMPLMLGGACLGMGFVLAGNAPSIWVFNIVHGLLIGLLGSSATFSPLMADTSLWFDKRRGIAVAICASGNYLGGAVWPPIVQHLVATTGWRHAYMVLAVFSVVTMVALALFMRARPPKPAPSAAALAGGGHALPFGMKPLHAQLLLCVAGTACCVAMAMPQVHIVAYCGDLGYGVARGAEMLAAMLGFGILSRIGSGLIADRLGGTATLLIGSVLQGIALFLYLLFDGLV